MKDFRKMNKNNNKQTQAFVYKWIHKPTGMWYIGSRTAKGCHINDGYICSSKIVKPMIEANPEQWERYILHTGLPREMRKMETKLLVEVNAKKNMMSFNRNNAEAPGGGRAFGSMIKKFSSHPDLHPNALRKLNEQEIASLLVNEKNLNRKFLIYDFLIPIVVKKGTQKCLMT
jgi:hypothetical protein